MTINNTIRNEKLQKHINRDAAKISALSSSEIDKNEFLTGKKISASDQRRIIEEAKGAQYSGY